MANFVDKLRLNSLIPSLGLRPRRIPEDEPMMPQIRQLSPEPEMMQSMQRLPPQVRPQQGMLNQIAEDALVPAEKRPGNLNNPNVVFKAPESDKIGMRILGYDKPISDYQQAQLGLRDKELNIRADTAQSTSDFRRHQNLINEKKVMVQQIAEDKKLSEGQKLKLQDEIERGQITHKGQLDSRLIQERGEENRKTEGVRGEEARKTEGVRGTNAQALEGTRGANQAAIEEAKARHAQELAALEANNKPVGSTTTETISGDGKTRTTTKEDRIRVVDKATGRTGTIPSGEFDAKKYDKVK